MNWLANWAITTRTSTNNWIMRTNHSTVCQLSYVIIIFFRRLPLLTLFKDGCFSAEEVKTSSAWISSLCCHLFLDDKPIHIYPVLECLLLHIQYRKRSCFFIISILSFVFTKLPNCQPKCWIKEDTQVANRAHPRSTLLEFILPTEDNILANEINNTWLI